jgi:hypothetical protein
MADDNNSHTVVPYRLVETYVRVRARRVETADPYAQGIGIDIQDLQVEIVQRADDDNDAYQELRTGDGSQELTVTLRPDERLQSVTYSHVGTGASVVTAGAKVVAFIGGIAVSVAKAFAAAGPMPDQQPTKEVAPAGQDARGDWAIADPEASQLLNQHKALATEAAATLVELRKRLVGDGDAAMRHDVVARVSVVQSTLAAARVEVSRLEAIYFRWRQSKQTVRSSDMVRDIPVRGLIRRSPAKPTTEPPEIPIDPSYQLPLWHDFRVLIEVIDLLPEDRKPVWNPPAGVAETSLVRWRDTRTAYLLVWRREEDDNRTLVSLAPITVADNRSDQHWIQLRKGAFGEHGGTCSFGEDGAPTTIHTADESTWKAVADALSDAPEALVGGLEQARKLTDTLGSIQDADAARRQAAAERDLAIAKSRNELLGVNATEEDTAALAKAEQAVKLRTATRALTPEQGAVDDLKLELDRVTAQADIEARRRQAGTDAQLVELKTEVARLEQEVLIARAKYEREHPDESGH